MERCPVCGLGIYQCETCGGMGCDSCDSGTLTHSDEYHLMNYRRACKNVGDLRAENDGLRKMLGDISSAPSHNDVLHDTEPEIYELLAPPDMKTVQLGDRNFTFGFCTNSPGGGGYSDSECVWIADDIVDPNKIIEFVVHESLHGIFPWLPEARVELYGQQISAFVSNVFRVKGVGDLPKIRKYADLKKEKRP